MPQDVFDEIEAPATSDVFDEIAPEKKDIFDEIEGGKPVIREVQPGSIPPTDLFPAIRKIGGEIVPGQIGDTHPDIIRREGIPATDIDQRGFTTPWGDFLDREAAAQGTQLPTSFEPGRLHSTDLSKFQEGLGKPLEEASAAEAPQPFVKLPEPSARPSPIAYAPVKAVFGQKGVDITKSVFDTVYNAAKSVPEFLQTEEGMLAMLASATPLGRAGVEAYFTGDMVKSLWDQAKSGVKDWGSLSAAQKAGRITQAIATLGFTGFLARAGIGTIKQAIKKPASLLAPTVPQVPSKPEEVTPEAVQAPPDIAKELGVESVGTSMGRDHYQFPTGKTEAGMEMDRVQVPAGSSLDVVRDAIENRKAQVAKDFSKEEPPAPDTKSQEPKLSDLSDEDLKRNYAEYIQRILTYGEKGQPVPPGVQKIAGDLVDEINRRKIPIIPHDKTGSRIATEPVAPAETTPEPAAESKPEIATLATGGAKNHLGDPLGTTYRATPEDWAAWQALQGKNLTEEGVFAERERIKNKYGGMPPQPPVAPKRVKPPQVPTTTALEKDLKRAKEGLQSKLPGALDFGYASGLADQLIRGEWKPGTVYYDYWIKKTDELKRAAWAIQRYFDTKFEMPGDRQRVKALKEFIGQQIDVESQAQTPKQIAEPTPVEPAPTPVAPVPKEVIAAADKVYAAEKRYRRAKRQEPSDVADADEARIEAEGIFRDLAAKNKITQEQFDTLLERAKSTETDVMAEAEDALQKEREPAPVAPVETNPEKAAMTHREFISSGKTEADWDAYAAEQNRISKERGKKRILEDWSSSGATGNDIANLIRSQGISIPESISKALQHDDTIVSSTSVSGRGMTRQEASKIHRWVSEKLQSPTIVGLGAAEKGEAAPGTQIEQLTQALKGVQEKRAPLVEQVKDAFSVGDRLSAAQDTIGKALSGMKAAGDMIISKWKGIPKIDDLLRAKKTLSRAIESRGWRLLKWEQQARKSVPNPRDQAAIAKWIDAGGDTATLQRGLAEAPDKFKQAYQDALNLSGDKLTTAQNVQNYFEARLQEAIDAGVLDHGIDNYIHRMYESKPDILKRAIAYTQTGLLKTNPALAKKRFFQFDWEAEKAGYVPVQSFIKRITAYEASLSKAIAAREFIKSASEMKASDGRPVIDIKGVGIPIEDPAGVYREATLIKPKFNPARNNEPTLPNGNPNPNYRGDYVNRDYRALSRWKWVGSDAGGKPIYVQGDVAIHPEYAGRVDKLLKPSQVRYGPYGHILRPALGVSSTIKQTMLDLSGFHPVQIAVHGMEHRVMPWSVIKDIDLSHPDVEGLLQGGVTLGGDYTGLHSEGLIGSSLTRRIPGLGPVMESYHQWLFQDFIPRIKMTMALHALERNRARYAGRMTEEQIFHKTASEANAAFGELNYTVLERSKTAQDMARLILLAPDFLEARARFAGQAFQRGGKAFGHEQRTALLLGALTMWVTARIANKMIDGQYHNEPENLFNIVKDGHAYGMRTVQGDLLHLLTKPMQFAMSRLNPVYARTLLEALTGRDYFGRKRTPAEQVWDAASTTIPISLRSNRERKLWESMLNGIGVTARRYSDVDDAFKLAQKWKDKNAVPERGEFIYDPNKDVLRPLKLALNHGDEVTAAKEIKALIDSKVYNLKKLDEYFKRFASMPFTGSKANDSKFIKSLTEDQRKTVEAARQHKNEIRNLYMKSRGQYLAPPSQL